ncbi:MAG TPA: lysoplasmalogenase family protein [Chakrabartia sp.]|jgi:uncharacterized membrane protein YhhN|nr:lysoplasmalogenase family protein [Chakrabartia sp.]
MPGTRLSQIALAFALVTGLGYLFVLDLEGHWLLLLWKGLPVWLLSLYAALNAQSRDGWLLALVMALGSLGDILIESDLIRGALAFAAGHLVAIYLYAQHRREGLSASQKALGFALVPLTPLIAWLLTHDPGVAFYALILGGMAAMAWTSTFPRYRVGLGAVFFVASDLLIFANMGVLAGQAWVSLAIWLLYFVGQAMIAMGVVGALSGRIR